MEAKKSPQANLERRRPLFVMAGAIVALSFSLVAFEWRTPYDIEKPFISGTLCDWPNYEYPPLVDEPEVKKPEPPKPPAAPPVIDGEQKQVADDTKTEPEPEPIAVGNLGPAGPMPSIPDEPAPEEPNPLDFVQHKARYNCMDESIAEIEMLKDINSRISYPWQAQEVGKEGTIHVRFVVDKEGKVSEVEVVGRKLGFGCEEEAIRVIKTMRNWCPAFHNGKMVASYYNLPVTFRLN